METGEGIISIINQVYNSILPQMTAMAASLQAKVATLAAIGAILYIFSHLISTVWNNQPINFYPYLRPFAILMLIPLSPAICTAIDALGNGLRTSISGSNTAVVKRIENNAKLIDNLIEEKWKIIGNDPTLYKQTFGSELAEDDGGITGLTDNLKLSMAQSSEEFKMGLVNVIQNILICVMYIAEACLILIGACFRLVLRMGFPITIALCIFPGFTNALAGWFAKYANFVLLPAIAALYSSICFAIMDTYLTNTMNTLTVDTLLKSGNSDASFLGFAYIGILILSIVGYFFVPSMTSMLVQHGGVGQIVSAVSNRTVATGNTIQVKTAAAARGAGQGAVLGAGLGAAAGNAAGSPGRVIGGGLGATLGAGIGAIKGAFRR
jgi:hypothetical protein